MTDELKVIKATNNTISVEWDVKWWLISVGQNTFSRPFALICDSYRISFFLSMNHQSTAYVTICIYCSNRGRAIVKLTTECNGKSQMRRGFIQTWQDPVRFDNISLGLVPPSLLNISFDVTWFGYSIDVDKKPYDLSEALPKASIFGDAEQPDFHIVIGDQKLPAHKTILAHYSSVLEVMFETPMKESKENEMTIKDIDQSTMDVLLTIMYTRMTDDLDDIDTALKVLQASEKYQMFTIKRVCERKLQVRIEDDNVIELLKEAGIHNASELCHSCVQYIVARNDKILSRDELDKMANENVTIQAAIYKVMFSLAKDVSFIERA